MYSKKDKFIYVHLPKCGGTFIKHYLLSNIDSEYSVNQNQEYYHEKYNTTCERALSAIIQEVSEWEDYFKFTIVRNPFDRVVSMFCFLGGWKYDYFIKNDLRPPIFEHLQVFHEFYKNEDFDGFIEEAYKKERIKKFHAGYFQNYVDRLSIKGEVRIDKYYKLEDIDFCVQDLCEKLKFNSDRAFSDWRKNSSSEYKSKNKYQDFYSDYSRDLITTHFKKDLDYFKYEF